MKLRHLRFETPAGRRISPYALRLMRGGTEGREVYEHTLAQEHGIAETLRAKAEGRDPDLPPAA